MPTEFAALVAIDWADQKHAWALWAGISKIETGAIDHTPEAIDVWAAELRMRFGRTIGRRGSRTIARVPRLHAGQIRAPRDFSGSPDGPRELPQEFSTLWSEERLERRPALAGHPHT